MQMNGFLRLGAAAAALVVVAGCAEVVDKALVRRHVLSIDEEGNGIDPYRQEHGSKEFPERIREMLEYADEKVDKLGCPDTGVCACSVDHPGRPRRVRRFLIHVHGGLNDAGTSVTAAERAIRAMLDEKEPTDRYFPFFVTWPSGGPSSYGEHLVRLRQGRHVSPLRGSLTAPIFVTLDLAHGVMNAPRTWLYQSEIDTGLAMEVAFNWTVLPSWEAAQSFYDHLNERGGPAPRLRIGSYRRGAGVQGARLLLYWATFPFKLLTSSLVLEGMGNGAWEVMLHRTQNALRRSSEFELDDFCPGDLDAALNKDASGAFARFCDELEAHICRVQEEDESICYQLTLVGHSMGAIILNKALQLFPDLPITRIVYMAPACSIGEMALSVVPFLKYQQRAEFALLTLHPLAEADEMNALDFVPRGSLLEWIDNFYTTPTSHLERRLGKWVNAVQALHLFKNVDHVEDRVSIKAFGVRCDSLPQKHGQFNLCPFWKRSFQDPDGPLFWLPVEGKAFPVAAPPSADDEDACDT